MSEIKLKLEADLNTVGTLESKQAVVKTAFNDPRHDMNPGELLANALGACMLTMIGFLAVRRGERVEGTELTVVPGFDEKHTRITSFALTFMFPENLTQAQKDFYAKAAEGCPVHNSLREDISYKAIVK
ncbi:OsmC family protein [Candidatus Avelusimicrobium caledoniensis]|uniref:OsmC family protein n=1 Tax=Candidatus Avelusimicrobium caledoniensis TaxID=3416220 RepID=UPI003D0CBA4C